MLFEFIRAFTNTAVRLFFPTKVIGRENLIKEGCILVCNHLSGWDIPIAYYAVPYKMNILGKKEVVKLRGFGTLYKKLGAIAVNRENVEPSTIREVIAVLKKGNKLLLFPEGTRKKPKGTRLYNIKSGAALFAISTGVPIIPMIIDKKPRIFRKNTLVIGKPFYVEEQKLNKENLKCATETIRRKMVELIDSLEKYKSGGKL